jgi:hypothetical protein
MVERTKVLTRTSLFGLERLDRGSRLWHRMSMNIERIRRRLSGGFRPFVIRTSDGREYEVPHPEFILIAPHEIGVVSKDGYVDTLAPLHIVSIRSVAPSNGK